MMWWGGIDETKSIVFYLNDGRQIRIDQNWMQMLRKIQEAEKQQVPLVKWKDGGVNLIHVMNYEVVEREAKGEIIHEPNKAF